MSTFSYPSDTFPAFPGVTLDCPQGWVPQPVPGAQLAVARPTGGLVANVVVVFSRLLPGQSLEGATDESISRFSALPGATLERTEVKVSGLLGQRIEASWTDPRAGAVTQAVHLAVVEHHGVADLVQITGTCGGPQAAKTIAAIRGIQDSVQIEA
jgi:hypothetical protein